MRFDTILIGGGLSSLVCGILLQRAGQRCLMVSAGQNALHFSSGAIGLLSRMPDGRPVDEPLAAVAMLPPDHPYRKIGPQAMHAYAESVIPFFDSCAIRLKGFGERNGYRLTPSGSFRPAWLAFQEVPFFASESEMDGSRALIVNLAGFMDFMPGLIAEGLRRRDVSCRSEEILLPCVEALRKNPGEMRSVGIARVMGHEENWKAFVREVRSRMDGEEWVILPEVFGLDDRRLLEWIAESVPARVLFLGTMPPSVSGIRVQRLLKNAFEQAGGVFLSGDVARDPVWSGNRVVQIHTENLGGLAIGADTFVLAGGHLFGRGLEALPDGFREPVFLLDVEAPSRRSEWVAERFFSPQPYLGAGVRTDGCFRGCKDARPVENLYVTGSELAGCNALTEGSGAGVAIFTGMAVADRILKGGGDGN